LKIFLLILGLLVIGGGSLIPVVDYLWRKRTGALLVRLRQGGTAPRATVFTAADLVGVPAPVVRYFRAVLRATDSTSFVTRTSPSAATSSCGRHRMAAPGRTPAVLAGRDYRDRIRVLVREGGRSLTGERLTPRQME
jgi:hypothetical protein